jgi:hypothetical protein
MASARPETLRIIEELQKKIQPDEGCAIQFSSVRFQGNPIVIAGFIRKILPLRHCNNSVLCLKHLLDYVII